MPVPLWRLAAAAAVVAAAVALLPLPPWPTLLAADGLLLVLAIVDAWRAPRPAALELERELPAVVRLGEEADVTWRLRNPVDREVRIRLADELVGSLRPDDRRARVRLPALGAAASSTRIRPARRGRFTPSRITVRVEGPLGLAARQATLTVASELRVHPPFRSRALAERVLARSRVLQTGLRLAQERGAGTEFDSLREYRVDDEFRRIDWAATARHNKAIVRSYRAERNQVVLVLVDTGRTMAARVGELPRLDHAMDVALMMTAVATGLGDRAGLVAFADRVRAVVPPGQRREQVRRVTEALYPLEPVLAESDYGGAFVETLSRFRRRALLVIVTELGEQAMTATLLPALPLVARHHLVLVAGVRDPAVEGWARSEPDRAGLAYRKAAALDALESRRRAAGRLRALGATVVDEPPGRLAPAVADAYLRVKAGGRL